MICRSFFVIKPTRCTNFTNLFCHETLHVSYMYSTYIGVCIWFITKKFVTLHGHMNVKICRRSKHVAVLVDFM
jgi:hypothetical protein